MASTNNSITLNEVSFCSSLAEDVWHRLGGPNAFESWHFDGVSDDGREALIISLYDNYVLSPRFIANSHGAENVIRAGRHRFPAVSLSYARDGKQVLGTVNEYAEGDFSWSGSECRIGDSSFRIDTSGYGSGFLLKINLQGPRGRRISAEVEWLLIESDLAELSARGPAVWNAAVPRADVSGRIELLNRRGATKQLFHFRGTGYHDQVSSSNVHYRDLTSRVWGRAHFVDSTLIFDRLGGVQNRSAPGKVYLIRNSEILEYAAACAASDYRRDRWGLRVPHQLEFQSSPGDIAVEVRPINSFSSGFSEVKTLSEVTLRLAGRRRSTVGLAQFVNPSRMRSRICRWISDLRIGRNERSPMF